MRISDWSSDVCSSDLQQRQQVAAGFLLQAPGTGQVGFLQATLVEQGGDDALVHSRFEVAVACDGVGSRVHVPLRQGESTLTVWEMHRPRPMRSEEHTSELQSLMRISYAVFCLKKKTK